MVRDRHQVYCDVFWLVFGSLWSWSLKRDRGHCNNPDHECVISTTCPLILQLVILWAPRLFSQLRCGQSLKRVFSWMSVLGVTLWLAMLSTLINLKDFDKWVSTSQDLRYSCCFCQSNNCWVIHLVSQKDWDGLCCLHVLSLPDNLSANHQWKTSWEIHLASRKDSSDPSSVTQYSLTNLCRHIHAQCRLSSAANQSNGCFSMMHACCEWTSCK